MNITKNRRSVLVSMTLGSILFFGCSSHPDPDVVYKAAAETLQQSTSLVSFNYNYTSLVAPAGPSATAMPLLRPAAVFDPSAIATNLGGVLGIGNDLSLTDRGVQQGLSRFRFGKKRLEIAERSASIRYTNQDLYNGAATKAVPDDARALALANALIIKLDKAGILKQTEVMWNAPHISHRFRQDAPGGSPVGPYLEPMSPRTMDTRVRYQRSVNNVPVSGSYIRVVFTDTEEIADLRVLWRPITVDAGNLAKPVLLSRSDAHAAFESSPEFAQLPLGTRVDVSVDEFVYQDGSKYDAVNFLEPGYMFLYTVKVPTQATDEFVVGKKLFRFFPATAHGEAQLPSTEAVRLQEQGASVPPVSR